MTSSTLNQKTKFNEDNKIFEMRKTMKEVLTIWKWEKDSYLSRIPQLNIWNAETFLTKWKSNKKSTLHAILQNFSIVCWEFWPFQERKSILENNEFYSSRYVLHVPNDNIIEIFKFAKPY